MMRMRKQILIVGVGIVCAGSCGGPRPEVPNVSGLGTAGVGAGAGAADPYAERTLDAFEDLAPWRASGSDGVRAAVQGVPGAAGKALRLDLDLSGTAGYAVARRELPLELPADFELSFDLRGEVPINHFELKLIDASGENVWWYRRGDYAFPSAWRRVRVKRRQIEFAWGPTQDKTLRRIAAIEVVVASGKGGGKGYIEIDRLALRPRPLELGPPPTPVATATSSAAGAGAALALDGDPATAWASDPAAGAAQRLSIDLHRERDLGGLLVRWADTGAAREYTVELSQDGAAWEPAASVTGGDGGLDPISLGEASARFVRLSLTQPRDQAAGYRLAEVELLEPEAGASANAFITALAKRMPRGHFPRGFTGEQPYWTVVGVDGGGRTALLSEDGALELAAGSTLGVSVEPFVEHAGATTSWATPGVAITQSLDGGDLPIPSVAWRTAAWELRITAVANGAGASSRLSARYTLHNRTRAPLSLRLVLAVRPYQVNPPTQFLNITGGVRRISELSWGDGALSVDRATALRTLTPPDLVGLWPSHALGYPGASLSSAVPPRAAPEGLERVDPAGLASGALAYDLELPPGGETSISFVAPLTGDAMPPISRQPAGGAGAFFERELAAARASWRASLDRVGFRVPPAGKPLVDTLRSSLAYMLLSREGPILRPGTRSYARAWIRDGAMIGEALLRLGHPQVAADFLRWYTPYQFPSGKVPCCVEAGGAVPVPEHDSHGQLIYLAATLYRYTGDRARLAASWPSVLAAARYMDELRQSERTPANQTPERRARYGLLPPSISHEGYSAKPAYSYWDDFWGLAGYKDAVFIASELGHTSDAQRLAAQRDEFRRDLLASIAASAAQHRVSFIPGAADLGDFDATSTTIALSPGGEQHALPQDLLRETFERAWREVSARPQSTAWQAYTPYELRLVGSFVRLGWRARAWDALGLYFADRRPAAWNQWAEVVGRLPREPRFIGDMPHAWVHSDYARSALDLFAYERDRDRAIVLGAGIPAAWFDGAGFAIDKLPTPYGPLSYDVSATPREITIRIGPGAVPPGGLVFPWPWPLANPPGATRLDGQPVSWRPAAAGAASDPSLELSIYKRPATLVITRPGAP